ncbi:protein phosphatase 1 regulatory subunit 3C [Oreochromis niloticus]|uniref:Protein phosphatase 1 regulatory subunit 3C n=1 Tax=Oreochromis niloticus TaxID=8128 RepID=A0A669CZ20_ORENI|nr:protein phosphatase 1 regulatory subunit 3C [Oreochromis niloticus]CAI5666467.1 unnamed protein product [Mustela putorius furo]
MSCTRVLHAFSHPQHAVNPVEMAKCLSLRQEQQLYELFSMSHLKSTKPPCKHTDYPVKTTYPLSHPSLPSTSSLPSQLLPSPHSPPENTRSCLRKHISREIKKQVVFADAKGFALTAVRMFIPEPLSPTSTLVMRPSPAKLEGQQSTSDKLNPYKLRLGFPQPAQDQKAFLARLQDMKVQLESCNISEYALSGKVFVAHVATEKDVCIRVTFDSWRSHRDIPCTFLWQHRCGGSDVDVFGFNLSLTHNMDPRERTEFCVSFRPGPCATLHWDNNGGQNYRVWMEKERSNVNQGNTNRSYPTFSKHRSLSWPLQKSISVQNYPDLQYIQKTQGRLENGSKLKSPNTLFTDLRNIILT